MNTLEITREQFEEFRKLQIKKHWKFPIAFGTNSHGEIWPTVTRGRTPDEKRDYVQGKSSLLDQVAGIYAALREENGRLFIDYKEAFWMDGESNRHTITRWASGEDLQPKTRKMTLQEYRRYAKMQEQEKSEIPQ